MFGNGFLCKWVSSYQASRGRLPFADCASVVLFVACAIPSQSGCGWDLKIFGLCRFIDLIEPPGLCSQYYRSKRSGAGVGVMSAAMVRKRSHLEEQEHSPQRSNKRLRGPVVSPVRERVLPADSSYSKPEAEAWVERLVKEMLNARDVDDAHVRGRLALEAVEKAVTARSSAAMEELQKENTELKEKMQVVLREGHILKRAVAIQHERQQEHEGRIRELQQAKQAIGQYQKQVRSLELENYTLKIHLRTAQDVSTSMPGRFHPDVY